MTRPTVIPCRAAPTQTTQRGYLLVAVAMVLTVIAVIGLISNRESIIGTKRVSGETETLQARYVAHAGMEHAKWLVAQNTSCTGYTGLPVTAFGAGSYSATVTPTSNSPVTLAALGIVPSGVQQTLISDAVNVYQAPATATLRSGPDLVDTYAFGFRPNDNYGSDNTIQIGDDGSVRYTLIQVDLAAIPPGATIMAAELALYLKSVFSAPAGAVITAHRMLEPWTGDGATYNTSDGSTPWTWPDNYAVTKPDATLPFESPSPGWYTWDIRELVEDWRSSASSNYGLVLAGGNGINNAQFTSSDDSDATVHPRLTITYACECGASGASGSTTLQPGAAGEDTYLRDGANKTKNFGAASVLKLNNASAEEASLLKFDLSSIPANAQIDSATIELWLEDAMDLANGVIDLHQVTQAWVEGDLDGSAPPAGAGATYQAFDGQTLWASPGGDYTTPALDTVTIPVLAQGWHQWNLTAAVQDWHSGATANDGVLLRASGGNVDKILFTSGDGNAAEHPKLTVNYSCPCGVDCGGGAAGSGGGNDILLVVGDAASPSSKDTGRKTLMESWGYTVTYIDDNDAQTSFDAAAAAASVVYVSGTIGGGALADKLTGSVTPIVNEFPGKLDNFGFSQSTGQTTFANTLVDISATHYITLPFPGPTLGVLSPLLSMPVPNGTLAAGLDTVGMAGGFNAVATLDTGATRWDGNPAPARRAQLPFAPAGTSDLTADGETVLKRTLEWAAGAGTGGGDGDGGSSPVPLAHWKLDDATGTTAVDSVGSHDGTLINAPAWDTGKLDGALKFDGINDRIDVPHDDTLSLTDKMTFTAWINASSFGAGYQTILAKDGGAAGSNFWFGTWQDELVFGFFAGGFFREEFSSGLNLRAGTWYHLAASFDNATGQVLLYVDGVQVHSGTIGFSASAVTADLTIGRSPDGESWRGLLDDVRIYDQALTAGEISDLAGGGGEVSCAATVLDAFNAVSYAGSDADPLWVGSWVEFGDSGSPTSADERVIADTSGFKLQIADNDNGGFGGNGEGVWREVNLSGTSTATLSFKFQRISLDNANDAAILFVSGDGGTTWSPQLWRTEGPGSDPSYQQADIDISAYVAPNTRIRFQTGTGNSGGDKIFFDDITLCAN